MTAPLVSAIIPVYNSAAYVREAIDSVLAQTYPHIEIIVVDDGSTDDSPAIVQSYGDRIRFYRQSNRGAAAARNRGLAEARGQLIAFLDADDLWLPDKTERQVRFLAAHPEYGVCYSSYSHFDRRGPVDPYAGAQRPPTPSGWIFDELLGHEGFVGIGTLMLRRSCLDQTGLFEETLRTAEDTNWFLRLARNCQFGHLPGPLARYRIHEEGITKRRGVRRGTIEALDHLVRLCPELDPARSARMQRAYAVRYLAACRQFFYQDDYREARGYALKALRYQPTLRRAWWLLALASLPAPWRAGLRLIKRGLSRSV